VDAVLACLREGGFDRATVIGTMGEGKPGIVVG